MPVKRTPEGWAKHYERARQDKQRKRLCPEYRKKENQKALARYEKDREKYNLVSNLWHQAHREEVNARKKKWRRDNPELARELDKKWRDNSINSSIAKFKRGDISIDELDRRLRETFVRLDEKLKSARRLGSNDSLRSGKTDPGPSES